MSTDTSTTGRSAPVAEPRHATAAPHRGVGVGGLLRGEWIKLRSLRSTWWTLGGALAAMIALGLVVAGTSEPPGGGDGGFAVDPVSLSLAGYTIAQLAVAVLGVLVVSGEYASGTVRSTFAAVPRRWPVVVAKAVVLGAVVFVTTTAAAFVSFFGGQALYGAGAASITDDGALRMVLGTGLYLTAIALLAMTIGWLLRSTAGGIASALGLILVLPVVAGLLPGSWGTESVRWLPSRAGSSLITLTTGPDSFGPWAGYAVLLGWVVALLVLATVLLRRRDV